MKPWIESTATRQSLPRPLDHGWFKSRYERFAAAIHPEDLAEVEADLQQVIAQKSQGSSEYRIILPDGSIRIIFAVQRAILDEAGKVTRLVGVNTDITDRQAAEDELFAEKERAQVTLNSIGDAVVSQISLAISPFSILWRKK